LVPHAYMCRELAHNIIGMSLNCLRVDDVYLIISVNEEYKLVTFGIVVLMCMLKLNARVN